ncbi:unnamed protein product [Blepharisma stoltei]|uniref:Uncharacterized protein n=1 Tax=Blepharisma stoltei TaxID=1481888 RepID=A0AAU9K806_9CILI|nr:unnamed protein product [Blepharisma stoltei]
MTDTITTIARAQGIPIRASSGEIITDQLIEFAIHNAVIIESICLRFRLSLLQVSILIYEYKKLKEEQANQISQSEDHAYHENAINVQVNNDAEISELL